MRLIAYLLTTVLAAGCGGPAYTRIDDADVRPTQREDRGNAIVAEHLTRTSSPYRKDHVRFTVRSEGETPEIYEVNVWRRQKDYETATMSLITKPADNAGAGSLSLEIPGKPTTNIIYSSYLDEFRETDTGKLFFGGLTSQELLGEWTKYDYIFVGENVENGVVRWEVTGKLKDGESSVIDTTRVLFDPDTFLPIEMHLFGRGGKRLRTYRGEDVRVRDGHAYVARTNVENHIYKSRITIEVLSREFPATIDDSMFSKEKLRQFRRK